jgi:hypothetical protein
MFKRRKPSPLQVVVGSAKGWRQSASAVKFMDLNHNGVWRSPVARLLWEQEVPGSNPGAPTSLT